jgi:hypothetical protein
MRKGDLAERAVPGTVFRIRARPGARRTAVEVPEGGIDVTVTAAAEGGKANAAILRVLARALGVALSRLTLVQGAQARDKAVRLD